MSKNRLLFLLIFSMTSLSVWAQQKFPVIPRDTTFNVPRVYRQIKNDFPYAIPAKDSLPKNVVGERNLVYATLPDTPFGKRELKLDLFHPEKPGKYPALILVHGGGWRSGDKTMEVPMAQMIASKGFVTVAVEYQLSLEAKYPVAVHNIKAAIRWMRANAEKYNIDPDRIVISGTSAGGQLAMLVGMTNGVEKMEGTQGNNGFSSAVQAVIDIDGVIDFMAPSSLNLDRKPDSPDIFWLGGSFYEKPEIWKEASSIFWANEKSVPVLFLNSGFSRFHSGQDELIGMMKEWNIYTEVHKFDVKIHPFWLFHPWVDQSVGYMTDFMNKVLANNSVRMAESIIKHNPSPNTLDGGTSLRWGYTQGLLCKSLIELSSFTGNKEFYKYAATYADSIVNEDGTIKTYTLTDYNIDQLNGGKILFQLYRDTHKEKFAKAIKLLRSQMLNHPRTAEGGFWHKKVYPHQMWLDGLYMGSPFLAQYAKEFNEPALFDDVINQFVLIDKHCYDPTTGLYYHGWDESREQKWANKTSGTSPNFWGRSVGWYAMALVDAMDYIPSDHPDRTKMIEIMQKVANGIAKNQDTNTGLWYQVLDQKGEPGNYMESTASTMFVYFLLKAVNNKYIDAKYLDVAQKGYTGILQNFIKSNEDGTISITNCCSVAGLGGSPRYRDGSYAYYISEKVINDDLKAVGPFILAGIELEKIKHRK